MIAKKPFVGGNWKCNGTKASLHDLIQVLNDVALDRDVDVVVAPTSLHIPFVQAHLKNPLISIAAQNCVPKPGAFTGEVALPSLVDHGVGWVIVGHSERRQIFNETDVDVAEKVQAALALGVSVIACIGETLPEREEGDFMNNHLKPQLLAILNAAKHDITKVVIAYEPVWAIGTGKVATPKQAEEVHSFLRDVIHGELQTNGEAVRIIYGGSVNAGNAAELYSQPHVDGFLVGGASLKPEFVDILKAVCSKTEDPAAAK